MQDQVLDLHETIFTTYIVEVMHGRRRNQGPLKLQSLEPNLGPVEKKVLVPQV